MILDKIVQQRKLQLQREQEKLSLSELKVLLKNVSRQPLNFEVFLKAKEFSLIAELKKASPSKGVLINDFKPLAQAIKYQELGAQAISCLTEEHYFQGSGQYLQQIRTAIQIPILRKDFIIDSYQIYESLLLGADAILLIAAILDTETLREFLQLATTLGLACLVEVHDEAELQKALQVGAKIIGINNRNLKTFKVDVNLSLELGKLVPAEILLISESGIKENNQIVALKQAGFQAALIGETLMCAPDLKLVFRQLLGGRNES